MKRLLLISILSAFTLRAQLPVVLKLRNDTLLVRKDHVLIFPAAGEYDQLKTKHIKASALRYKVTARFTSDTILTFRSAGIFYVAAAVKDSIIVTPAPLWKEVPCTQVRVRESDDYAGVLTGMLGAPFIIPPKKISGGLHQSDLGMGTDCAGLAVYGMRQQGHDIAYLGPHGILPRLETSELKRGCIIHFGFQVSILYEDRGAIGVLDKEDLLIHANKESVRIETLEQSGFRGRKYEIMRWKSTVAQDTTQAQ